MSTDIRDVLQSLDGLEVVGGCDHCDAYTSMRTVTGGVFIQTIHHDDWCRFYRRQKRGQK